MGNVTAIYQNGALSVRYLYDKLNRLVREDNKSLDKTTLFVYDNNGNILSQRVFNFTLKDNTLIEELSSTDKEYLYNGDRLLSFNGEVCSYDLIGNPTTYRGKSATWSNGRQLTSFNGNNFSYDGQGRRVSKNSISYLYDSNNRLISQGNYFQFFYDNTGIAGCVYNDQKYLYRKDALGNVIAILSTSGNVLAKYVYDAWGNHTITDANGNQIADTTSIAYLNPFRYRSYYYDTETNLYYLKTRYYDPQTGRFITIDGVEYLDPDTINGANLYAYCLNNPIANIDEYGCAPKWIWSTLKILAGFAVIVETISLAVFTKDPISVGAAVGSIIGGISAAFTNLFTNGTIHEFANAFMMSTLTGALSGALVASTIAWQVIAVVGALLEVINYSATQALNGENPTFLGIAVSALVGTISSKIGLSSSGVSKIILPTIASVFKSIAKGVLEEFFNSVIYSLIGGLHDKIEHKLNPTNKFILPFRV